MTSFGSYTLNVNPFRGPQASLPLASFRLFQGTAEQVQMAWVFAFVLLAIVLILFVTARAGGRRHTT
jgi:ABC-type phosphate transport system permease subunit